MRSGLLTQSYTLYDIVDQACGGTSAAATAKEGAPVFSFSGLNSYVVAAVTGGAGGGGREGGLG